MREATGVGFLRQGVGLASSVFLEQGSVANNARHIEPGYDGLESAPGVSAAPAAAGPESMVVLTDDADLLQTLSAIAPEDQIFRVGVEADLAGYLLENHAGVAIIDTASVTSPIAELAVRLKSQFPDLVLVVAGNLDDQAALAALVTSGTVYRFLHKPVSEQRVRLFVNAAWRRHGVEHAEIVESTATNLRRPVWVPVRRPSRKTLWMGATVAGVLVIASAIWLFARAVEAPAPAASGVPLPISAATNDAELEKLLARAGDALGRGALTSPPGASAVDLYRQALARNGEDPRARVGLGHVMEQLLDAAEKALLENRVDDAQRLTAVARTVQPDHVRVAFLTAQIGKERERALLAQARQAAARGKMEEAIAVLDRGRLTNGSSTLMSETRNELAQRKVEDSVSEFLQRANDRMRRGALIEPAQDNARFFIESARALAPNDGTVRQAQRQLGESLVAQARAAIAAGNADDADKWIEAAGDSGVSRDDIVSLTGEARRARIAAHAESMAKLSQSFNQRLSQGRLVEPANDSAKFYLAQLVEADANHPSTRLAREALSARFLEEARGSIARHDYARARRWSGEARGAGAGEQDAAAIERNIAAAQESRQRANEIISASSLQQTRYIMPEYPTAARQRGTSGWVELVYTVRADGTVGDVTVSAAEPAGIFEQAAMNAVLKWRYEVIRRDGQPVEQRARVRVRFAMEP